MATAERHPWLRLEPGAVPAADKCRRFSTDHRLARRCRRRFPTAPEPISALKAPCSAAVGNMRESVQRALLPQMLTQWRQAQVGLLQSLDLQHPRLHDLSALAARSAAASAAAARWGDWVAQRDVNRTGPTDGAGRPDTVVKSRLTP